MKKILLSLLLVLACSLPVQAAEMVTINDTSKDDVYNYILTRCMKAGYTIQENNEHSLIFRNDNTSMNFAVNWGSDAYIQLVFNFAQTGNDVLISHEIRAISGNKIHPFTKEAMPYYFPANKDDAEVGLEQTFRTICDIKHHFNGGWFYGFAFAKKKKDYIEVVKISPSYPAEIIGLKKGDQIIKINDQAIKKITTSAFDVIIRKSSINNESVALQVRREKNVLNFSISPMFVSVKELEAQ